MRGLVVASLCLLTTILPAHAQGVGVAGHVGTLGVGVDLAVSVAPRLGLRAGANIFPFEIDATADDIEYTVDPPSPQYTAMLDLYLIGAFRVSGGIMVSPDDINLTGILTQDVEIGNTFYTPAQVGTLTGAIINKDTAPYLGIGIGNPGAARVGFFLDAGVAFHGKPQVRLGATGPVSTLPSFQANVETEQLSAEQDLEPFQYYPVLSLGFSIRLAR